MISLNQKQLFSIITIFIVVIVITLGFSTYFYLLMSPLNRIGMRIEGDLLFEVIKKWDLLPRKTHLLILSILKKVKTTM
jgi:hypothetical protein